MRCVMCHRPILTPAVTVPTKNGPLGYGPVCARKAGLAPRITCTRAAPARAVKTPGIAQPDRCEVTKDMFEEIA